MSKTPTRAQITKVLMDCATENITMLAGIESGDIIGPKASDIAAGGVDIAWRATCLLGAARELRAIDDIYEVNNKRRAG